MYIKKGHDSLKTLKKYISVLAALAMIGAFITAPVYALPEETPDETVDVIAEDSEDPEEDGEVTEIDEPDAADIDTSVTETSETGEVDLDEQDLDDPDEEEDPEDAETPDPDDATLETPEPVATQPAITSASPADMVTYNPLSEYTGYAIENINVRSGPGTSYSIIGSVSAPNSVTVKGYSGEWLAIDYYGGIGFVSGNYITNTPPTTTATTAATAAPVVSEQPIASETTSPAVAEVDPQPADTTESIPDVQIDDDSPEPAVTTTQKAPAQTTTTTKAPAAASDTTTDSGSNGGGITGLLIAAGCAVGTFLLVGVVPVVVHSIYHKKMYEY